MLEAHGGDDAGFGFGFVHGEVTPVEVVVGVETAVAALVGAVVGHVERREEIHGASEVAEGEGVGALRHAFEVRFGRGGEQDEKVFGAQGFFFKRGQDLGFGGAGGYFGATFAGPLGKGILKGGHGRDS